MHFCYGLTPAFRIKNGGLKIEDGPLGHVAVARESTAAFDASPQSKTLRAISPRLASLFASWTASAKRSGAGAFARTRDSRAFEDRCPQESVPTRRDFRCNPMTPRRNFDIPRFPIAG